MRLRARAYVFIHSYAYICTYTSISVCIETTRKLVEQVMDRKLARDILLAAQRWFSQWRNAARLVNGIMEGFQAKMQKQTNKKTKQNKHPPPPKKKHTHTKKPPKISNNNSNNNKSSSSRSATCLRHNIFHSDN